jgi:hypothetical protein
VIKQVNGNPSKKAEGRGWELLATAGVHFPPSKTLLSYALTFVAERTMKQGPVGGLALFVMRQLRRQVSGRECIHSVYIHLLCAAGCSRVPSTSPRTRPLTRFFSFFVFFFFFFFCFFLFFFFLFFFSSDASPHIAPPQRSTVATTTRGGGRGAGTSTTTR